LRKRAGEYLLASAAPAPERKRDGGELKAQSIAAGELQPLVTARWRDSIAEKRKAHHPVLAPWFAYTELKAEDFGAKSAQLAAGIAANADPQKPINALVAKSFAGDPPTTLA
jgi:hypothetical protein